MTSPNSREWVEEIVQIFQHEYGQYTSLGALSIASDWLRNTLHQELQKTREEERKRAINVMRDRQIGWLGQEEDGSDRHPFYDEIQTIIDRYSAELDQPNK